MKTKQEQIDEMVKVIKGFDICGLFGRCFSTGADGENTRFITCPECFAEALYNAGYGDVSEYKAEIERLRTTLGQCNTELNSALESLKSQCREIGELRAKVKQAKIDVLNELKGKMFEREYMGVKYKERIFYESEIDDMIAEVQNGEDKG